MMRKRFAVVAVALAALMGLALAGCGKEEAPELASDAMPDFSQVLVQDENAAMSYLGGKFVVEGDVAYSSEECAAACPSMDRAAAEEAGKALNLPGEWAMYDISPSNAIFRLFGITVRTTNVSIIDSLDVSFGVDKAVAYSIPGEDKSLQRVMWVELDDGTWLSLDSSDLYFVNFAVWGPSSDQVNENVLAQHVKDIKGENIEGISDIYIMK